MSDPAADIGSIRDRTVLAAKLSEFSTQDLLLLRWQLAWKAQARIKQLPPEGEWRIWGIRSGRGFGKTLAASQWMGQEAARDPNSYNFVVAPKYDDVRYTCFEGPTGLFSVIPQNLIEDYNLTLPSITLTNGAFIRGFGADAPERLRGPQCHRVWCEEIASWRYPKETWDNLMFGLRLGKKPRVMWTGTPKPKPFIRVLQNMPKSIVVTGSTYENSENLDDAYYENIAKYEGTAIGRQEIYGDILDPEDAGFVKRRDWRIWPSKKKLPKFRFIVMSLDTAFTENTFNKREQTGDPTACTVWGLFEYDHLENIMLLDAWEEHLGFPALIKRVKSEMTFTYGDADEPLLRPLVSDKSLAPRHQGRTPDVILIENKGSGISLRQQLAVENIFTEPYNPGDLDKLSRLHACSPLFPARRIWAVESDRNPGEPRSWGEPVISQVCTYVGEGSLEHDDLLDTSTQALLYLMHKYRIKFTSRPDPGAETAKALEALKRKERKSPYG